MMKWLKKLNILLIFGVLAILASCTPAQTIQEDAVVDEGVSEEEIIVDEEAVTEDTDEVIIEKRGADSELVDGYRVRAAEASSLEEANELERTIADELHVPVYVEFIVDKYMIYVGDCQNRDEAEDLKTKLKLMGYTKRIFIAPKKVLKKQTIKVATVSQDDDYNSESDDVSEVVKRATQGYRVQLFAGINKENAEKIRDLAREKTNEKIYIIIANNLYKVQAGNFHSRLNAEELMASVQDDFPGCFIQRTMVVVEEVDQISGKFYVQLGAFASKGGAQSFQATVREFDYANSIIFEENEFYKVLIGAYETRDKAEEIKEKLIQLGFDGAWIVEK